MQSDCICTGISRHEPGMLGAEQAHITLVFNKGQKLKKLNIREGGSSSRARSFLGEKEEQTNEDV